MYFKILSCIILILPTIGFTQKKSQSVNPKYKANIILQVDSVLWSFSFINKNEVLVTEKAGKLYHIDLISNKKTLLKSPKIKKYGQGGLLDVWYKKISHLNYVYLTFSEDYNGKVVTSLARGLYKNKKIINLKTIFRSSIESDNGRHFGSRIVFKEKYLFMTVGDRGEREYAQSLLHHNGKILRLNLDGSVPKDNPFVGNKKALDEIWSYGHRNPQGIDIDPITNKIYSVEFGPRGGDELNLIKANKNYGWPIITYGKEYWGPSIGKEKKRGLEQPITYWTPSISPSGMAFYTGEKIPEFINNLFLASLSSTHLRRLIIKNNKVTKQQVLFKELKMRIRHVRTSPDGYLYFSTDSGKLFKVMKLD